VGRRSFKSDETKIKKEFISMKQNTLTNLVILILFLIACGTSSPQTVTSDNIGSTQTAAVSTIVAGINQTLTSNAPTNTALPTNTPEPTATLLFTPTSNQIALSASCIPNNTPETGKVVDVVDGDTIKVLLDQDGQTYTVRYIGMDTPENTSQVEYFGAEAATKNVQLVFGKPITLIKDISETDIYGRLLRYVIIDNIFINYELVAQGYANTASYPPDIACIPTFQDAEQKARASNLGLWNAPPTLVVVIPEIPDTGGNQSGSAVCNCSGPDLDCKAHFSTHAEAQDCYNYCVSQGFGDVFRLDGNDNDGLRKFAITHFYFA